MGVPYIEFHLALTNRRRSKMYSEDHLRRVKKRKLNPDYLGLNTKERKATIASLIEWNDTNAVRHICGLILQSAGYKVDRPGGRVWVLAYGKVWIRVLVEFMRTRAKKGIVSGIRISFYNQLHPPQPQPKMWLKARIVLDDDYGNYHWYVDPKKLIAKLEQAVEHRKQLPDGQMVA